MWNPFSWCTTGAGTKSLDDRKASKGAAPDVAAWLAERPYEFPLVNGCQWDKHPFSLMWLAQSDSPFPNFIGNGWGKKKKTL